MAEATKVATGQQSAAAHLNAIISDIRTHNHSAGQGGKVSHGDLADGSIGGTLTHAQIDQHIKGSGSGATQDTVGGAEGVHGLPVGVFVAGSRYQKTVVYATGQYTTTQFTSPDNWLDVNFDITFAEIPAVFVIPTSSNTARTAVQNVTTNGCRVLLGNVSDTQQGFTFRLLLIGRLP